MASKIVFFILTVSNINIVWTAVFPSNVHEMMTPEEISQTFGTDDGSVPDYQVMSMVLPGPRRRRQADDEIYVKVKIKDAQINLTFTPTAGYLATRYTPVWSAVTDQNAYNKIRYDPLLNAMKDIGEFKMYQDVNNEAAIVVFTDPDHETIIEGIVTPDYAIKSLPKRLMNQTLLLSKRSIKPDANEVTGHFVLFESPPSAEIAKRNVYRHVEKRRMDSAKIKRNIPEALYPEILLILDHNAIRNHTITQSLRFMLALWNGADMIYSTLNNPKVYLNIAGIIISADDAATPYITADTSIKIKEYSDYILDRTQEYFAKELDRFPLSLYDMILVMTSIKLCYSRIDDCESLLGIASPKTACTSKQDAILRGVIDGVAVVYYNWTFGGVHTAAHETAHLFGVNHDEGVYYDEDADAEVDCNYTEGYAMTETTQFSHQRFKWSPCSVLDFQNYFSLSKSECLDNEPMWTTPVEEVLPGRWLNLDGQCQNRGFRKSCRIADLSICMGHRCKGHKKNKCDGSKYIPLPGTKCGENKYCKTDTGCVDE